MDRRSLIFISILKKEYFIRTEYIKNRLSEEKIYG